MKKVPRSPSAEDTTGVAPGQLGQHDGPPAAVESPRPVLEVNCETRLED